MFSVDVIIPTYKPKKDFLEVLDLLNKQTMKPGRIILMNTEEYYFDQFIYGTNFLQRYDNCKVYHLSKLEYDHGETRNRGVAHSKADYFVMMTQDALPKDERLIENLLKPLLANEAVVSYAKQLPKADCNPVECYTRAFNYPENSRIKGEKDLPQLGIKTYFCSDVCAAYNRKVFDELHGFINGAIFNEDMVYAAKAAKSGYMIAYCADACVYHSHNYTASQQFRRNFDLGVSQADHPEVFGGIKSEGEGIRMVRDTMAYLWNNGYKTCIPRLIIQSGAKFIGYRLGKNYHKLTENQIHKFTSNPDYWRRKSLKRSIKNIDATKGYGKNPEQEGE